MTCIYNIINENMILNCRKKILEDIRENALDKIQPIKWKYFLVDL